jgi:hypothetical protein
LAIVFACWSFAVSLLKWPSAELDGSTHPLSGLRCTVRDD